MSLIGSITLQKERTRVGGHTLGADGARERRTRAGSRPVGAKIEVYGGKIMRYGSVIKTPKSGGFMPNVLEMFHVKQRRPIRRGCG